MTAIDTRVATPALRPRDRRGRRPVRTRLDAFPRDPVARWALRLALGLPFIAVALLLGGAGGMSTPNQQLLDQIAAIQWTGSGSDWVGMIYPPLSTLVAMIIPGGRIGLSILGGLLAGILLQKMAESLVQRHAPTSTSVVLMVALAANPLFYYTALEAFPTFLGLLFFGLAVADAMRFVVWRNTRSGFRSGILLMLSTLSAPSGLLYATTTAAATPFLQLGRAGQRGARGANLLVIIFPTIAALGSLVLLELLFLRTSLGNSIAGMTEGMPERAERLATVLFSPAGLLFVAPVVCAWAFALIVRRPGAIAVSTLTFAAVLGAYVIGLIPSNSAGLVYILFALMAIALIPTARGRWTLPLIDTVAVVLLIVGWIDALQRTVILDWLRLVFAPLGIGFSL